MTIYSPKCTMKLGCIHHFLHFYDVSVVEGIGKTKDTVLVSFAQGR